MLYGHGDHKRTFHSMCMRQKLPFSMKTQAKMTLFGQKLSVLASAKELQTTPLFGGFRMQRIMLNGHTDRPNTVYSTCMHRNVSFCNKKRHKMATFGQKNFFLPQTTS